MAAHPLFPRSRERMHLQQQQAGMRPQQLQQLQQRQQRQRQQQQLQQQQQAQHMLDEANRQLHEAVGAVLADGLRRLVDGNNQTCDPQNMFLMPFSPSCASLQIDLGQATAVQGLKFWNFNASLDDSYRGLRRINVILDGVLFAWQGQF